MKVINIKNETCQTKHPIKKKKKIHAKKRHTPEFFTCKNTKIQSRGNITSKHQKPFLQLFL